MMIIDENFLTEWYRLMYALIERLDDVDENDIKHLRWQRQNKLKNLIWTKIDQLQNPKKHLIKMDANTSSSSSNNNNNNSINHHHHEIKHNNDFDNNNNNNNREKQSLPHETTTTNNCKSINKIVCDAYKSCGFGCFVHHMAYCLIAALALNRTLILYPSIENFDFSDEISSSSKNNHYYQRLFKSFKSINSICDINSSDGGGGGDGGPQQQKSPSNDWMSNAVNINDVINHKQNQKLKTIDRNNNNDDDDDNIELIYLPIIENLDNRAKFRPMAIPEQLRKHLEQLTRMPFVVFLGSIISYIMRLNDEFERKFLQYRQRIKFRINDDDNDDDEIFIGIHVRRTDKLFGEGEYYPLSDYMKIVQRIYDRIDIQDAMMMMEKNKKIKKRERKIYLATDDITVWQNEVPQYIKQGYRFYGDSQITKSASPGQRNTAESFDGFIMDVLSLSYTDYLVCTFSSQVCRLAYELMQVQRTNGRDMSTNFYSLDDVYYFGGQISHRLESIMANHHPPPYVHNGNNDKINNSQKQHKFNVGDSLGIEKNLHNGYYLGDLYETKIQRLLDRSLAYPIFKVIEKIDSTSFKAFE
ncbi:alpha-(1,6)-fucosyltransferase-like isoform X2 [Dermatophagoides farinae]